MLLNKDMENYIRRSRRELLQLIRDLCAIPAPSHHEQARAEFCRDWFEKNCGHAFIDEALNVICPWGDTGENDLIVFMAHTDTVFPDIRPMPFSEDDKKMYCPGVTDDTANLAVMMICARYVMKERAPGKTGMLFIANSCEEGLGNLKGSRRIVKQYGSRIRELITLDGTNLRAVVTEAVGSHRYRVTVRTQGGHSFANFGNANAIHHLSAIVSVLYAVKVPVEGNSKTTYNVGMVSGGTSVNTIAQQAEMLYEYRSDSLNCLQQMEKIFRGVIEHFGCEMEIEVEKIGDRPCTGNVCPEKQQALVDRIEKSIRKVTGRDMIRSSGSTDANAALGAGIPAACISVCAGGGCHTREEWLDVSSLAGGCRLFLDLLDGYLMNEASKA